MTDLGVTLGQWRYPLAAVVLVLLTSFLRRFLAFQNLLKIRLRPFGHQTLAVEDVPPSLVAALAPATVELAELGLAPVRWLAVTPIVDLEPSRSVALLLCDPSGRVWATLGLATVPEPSNAIGVDLYSFTAGGRCLLTVNGTGHQLIDEIPDTDVEDPYAETLTELWATHRARLSPGDLALSPDELLERIDGRYARYLEALVASGSAVPAERPERFAITPRAAWRTARRAVAGASRLSRLLSRRAARATIRRRRAAREGFAAQLAGNAYTDVEVPAGLEAEAFLRGEDLAMRPNRRGLAGWALVVTSLLFVLSLSHLIEPDRLALVVAAVAFHEAGHLVAMRLRGYRDTSIFFIPFFGAAATGRKQDASLADELIVLLAGPLPGILLGIALELGRGWLPSPELAREALFILVGLNGFNLLPVPPLDGGRVVQALLASRSPGWEVSFRLVAVGALMAVGLALDSVVLQLLAVLQGVGVPTALREARLRSAVRDEVRRLGTMPASPAALVFRVLDGGGGRALTFARKTMIVRPIFRRLLAPEPTARATVGGLLAYLGSWGAVVVALVVAIQHEVDARVPPMPPAAEDPARSLTWSCGGDASHTNSLVLSPELVGANETGKDVAATVRCGHPDSRKRHSLEARYHRSLDETGFFDLIPEWAPDSEWTAERRLRARRAREGYEILDHLESRAENRAELERLLATDPHVPSLAPSLLAAYRDWRAARDRADSTESGESGGRSDDGREHHALERLLNGFEPEPVVGAVVSRERTSRWSLTGEVDDHDPDVVEVSLYELADLSVGLPALLDDLCQQGCTSVEYTTRLADDE